MINRIRAIRKQQGLTLADLAERCSPPTTPQTIGRLETGMRTLSIEWLNRIAAALEVEPHALLSTEAKEPAMVVARLSDAGAEALSTPREAIPPTSLLGDARLAVLEVSVSAGEYRAGDQLWLRETPSEDAGRALNRDVLVPRPGGRFTFGRLIDRDEGSVAILPPGAGQRQTIIANPPWIAVAIMLVRTL